MKRSYLSITLVAAFLLCTAADVQAQYVQRTQVRVAYEAGLVGGTLIHMPNLTFELPFASNQSVGVRAATVMAGGTTSFTTEVSGIMHMGKEGAKLDPYAGATIGWGFGAASGFVAGSEVGVNYWLGNKLAVNLRSGYLKGVNSKYPKVGAGVTLGL